MKKKNLEANPRLAKLYVALWKAFFEVSGMLIMIELLMTAYFGLGFGSVSLVFSYTHDAVSRELVEGVVAVIQVVRFLGYATAASFASGLVLGIIGEATGINRIVRLDKRRRLIEILKKELRK